MRRVLMYCALLCILLATPVLADSVNRTELWYATSGVSPAQDATAVIGLASTQDGGENNADFLVGSTTLYTFMQATMTQPQTVLVTPSDTITFTSYFTLGGNVNEAYVTARLIVDSVTLCQSGNDGTLGALITTATVITQTCAPASNTTIAQGSSVEYRITVWAQDVSGGQPATRRMQLRWDTVTANTSVTINSSSPLSITTSANDTSYAQGETVNVSGLFTEFGGAGVLGNVTVTVIAPNSTVMQSQNVTSTASGAYADTYPLPATADTGTWTAQVRGWYSASVFIDNSTTFTVFDPPPTIHNTTITPTLAAEGELVTVTANVTDNAGVSAVYAQVYFPNGTLWQNTSMNGPNPYTVNITAPSLPTGTYSAVVWANDTASASTQGLSVQFTPYLVRGEWANITLDGIFSDWENTTAVSDETNTAAPGSFNITALTVANNNTHLAGRITVFGVIDLAHPDNTYRFYISTTSGGVSTTPQAEALPFGYEYRLEIASACEVYDNTNTLIASCVMSAQAGDLEFAVSFAALGITFFDVVNITAETGNTTDRLDILPNMNSFVAYTIVEEPLAIDVSVQTNQPLYLPGQTVNASGVVTWNNGTPITGQSVLITFRTPENSIAQQQTVLTNASGAYGNSYTLTFSPSLGEWSVEAFVTYNASLSGGAQIAFTVDEVVGPGIINFSILTSETTANISWNSNDPGNMSFSYGVETLNTSISNATLSIAHSISLTGLAAGTKYSYLAQSCNVDGCSTRQGTFFTLPPDGYCTYRYAVKGTRHLPGTLTSGDIVVIECRLPAELGENLEVITRVVVPQYTASARFVTPRLLTGDREVLYP